MTQTRLFIFTAIFASSLAITATGADAGTNSPADDQVEANYTKAIEGRTADILKVLALTDTNKVVHVHDAVMAQYRSLRAWHDENDAKLKAVKADTNAVAQTRGSLKVIHDAFLTRLEEELSPLQVDQVKDKMTYGKVQFTFAGYLAAYPDLTEENKQRILEILKQAREEAMDGGSANEKTAIFTKAKGKINNYLSKQGVQSEKKKKTSAPATSPPSPQ